MEAYVLLNLMKKVEKIGKFPKDNSRLSDEKNNL